MAHKPALVLLPGLLCTDRLWGHQIESLKNTCEIFVPDLTGFDSMAGLAQYVLDQVPERFSLAGLSMGGYVAQEIMRQAPGRVDRLALIDTSPLADTPEATEKRQGMMELARTGHFDKIMPVMLPQLLHPDHLANNILKGTVKAMAAETGPDAFIRQQKAIISRPDSRESLKNIACPTLVLCGQQDALTPPDLHREMHDIISDSTLVLIDRSGHLSPMEQPEKVSRAIKRWMTGE